MTVVMSDTSVLVSRPMSSSLDSPPKIDVRRRMKVDLPQPESAATPTTTGSTIWAADARATTRDCDTMEVAGENAAPKPTARESICADAEGAALRATSGGEGVRALSGA